MSEIARLEAKMRKLLEESFKLSSTNRRKSDEKAMEAEEIRQQIEKLEKESA